MNQLVPKGLPWVSRAGGQEVSPSPDPARGLRTVASEGQAWRPEAVQSQQGQPHPHSPRVSSEHCAAQEVALLCLTTETSNPSEEKTSKAEAANLCGTRDWFRGRRFVHRPGQGNGFRMLQAHYMHGVLYFFYYYIAPSQIIRYQIPEVGALLIRSLPAVQR